MTTNGHSEQEIPGKNAGFEEAFGIQHSGGVGYGFDPVAELSRGSINPEEWMPRSEYTVKEITIRALRTGARHRARYGWTNTELVDWHRDHMKMALGRERMKELVDMVIGSKEAQRERLDPERSSRFLRIANNQQERLKQGIK